MFCAFRITGGGAGDIAASLFGRALDSPLAPSGTGTVSAVSGFAGVFDVERLRRFLPEDGVVAGFAFDVSTADETITSSSFSGIAFVDGNAGRLALLRVGRFGRGDGVAEGVKCSTESAFEVPCVGSATADRHAVAAKKKIESIPVGFMIVICFLNLD